MSKAEQILQIEPPYELRFIGPFLEVVTTELRLTNPTEKIVCFKVKTTAPKRYCVRPNSGLIQPNQSVCVQVMLQPFEYDPMEKNKHKFMVQSMFAPDGPIESQENLWHQVATTQIMDSKLRCVFEMPDSAQTSAKAAPDSVADASQNVPIKSEPISPVASLSKTTGNLDVDLNQALDDCRRLRSEVSQLRTENNTLRDEGVRLRKVMQSDTVRNTPPPSPSNAPVPAQPGIPPIVYLIAAILLGLILGKWIL